jgi:subtilisin family serine protease
VIAEALSKGVIIIAASGNDAIDNDILPSYPCNYPGIISIGATRSGNTIADFSNYGYSTPLFAPGHNIYSTVPGNGFESLQGTSMAAPVAVGVFALV